jgi:hypothetical protein
VNLGKSAPAAALQKGDWRLKSTPKLHQGAFECYTKRAGREINARKINGRGDRI